jgi:hypothetical protein
LVAGVLETHCPSNRRKDSLKTRGLTHSLESFIGRSYGQATHTGLLPPCKAIDFGKLGWREFFCSDRDGPRENAAVDI